MKYIPKRVEKWLDNNLSRKGKMRFVLIWFWVADPISMLKYHWEMYKNQKEGKKVRKFLKEEGLEIDEVGRVKEIT